MKKVLVISTTLRKGGNSEVLAEEFARGAKDSGNDVEFITLRDKTIKFCIGCLTCVSAQKCVLKDDANGIVQKIADADVIAFATPVYYYEMSGQMKTLLDRSNPNFTKDYNFRDIYLITAAAEGDKSAMDGTIAGLNGWVSCFEKSKLKGVVYGTGLTDIGDARHSSEMLKDAYQMGEKI